MTTIDKATLQGVSIRWLSFDGTEPTWDKKGKQYSLTAQIPEEEEWRADQWRETLGLKPYKTEFMTWAVKLKNKIRRDEGPPVIYGLRGKPIQPTSVGNESIGDITITCHPYDFITKEGERVKGVSHRISFITITTLVPSQRFRKRTQKDEEEMTRLNDLVYGIMDTPSHVASPFEDV